MVKKKRENTEGQQVNADSGSTSVGNLNVGRNVGGNLTIGNTTVNNYYQQLVEQNTKQQEPDYWALKHPYPMSPNFTGRIAERAILTHWLKEDSENRLFILRALGGFGKSALAWQWLTHDVDIREYPKLVWWSFYEGDASFEHFIEETLKYLKLEIPQGLRPQVDELLKAMQSQRTLLIMDGFERLLRAYNNMNASHQGDEDRELKDADRDCVDINVEHFLKGICSMPNVKSKALMTSRLTPRALEKFGQFIQGCREEALKAMHKDDAILFFRAQGIHKGTNREIEEVCRLYGFHPLSLRLLAGHIITDLKNAGDIIVAQKLKVSGDVVEHQNHILEISYNGLHPRQQKLLSTIACFRSSTKLDTLELIAENKNTLDEDLHDLMERGLVQFDKNNSIFDLHPIVRRYAYECLTAPDRNAAHTRLKDYFETVPKSERIENLEDIAHVIELYYHTVRAEQYDEAWKLFRDRIWKILFWQLGVYQTQIELLKALFIDGDDKLPKLQEESNQAHAMNELANAANLIGLPKRAEIALEGAISIARKLGEFANVAVGLSNLGFLKTTIGSLQAAENSLRESIRLCQEFSHDFEESIGHHELGRLLSYCGRWEDAERELTRAQQSFDKLGPSQTNYGSVNRAYLVLHRLLMSRDHTQSSMQNRENAIKFARRSLELAKETARTNHPYEYDFVFTHWLLGAAYRFNEQFDLAENHLAESLRRDRSINLVDTEADILLDLARLRYDQKNYEEAKTLAEEALTITERCGYVLQGADVNLFLAQYALEQEKDKAKAKEYAETALKLAYCDGPPYYYKVAYHEAERFLENLK